MKATAAWRRKVVAGAAAILIAVLGALLLAPPAGSPTHADAASAARRGGRDHGASGVAPSMSGDRIRIDREPSSVPAGPGDPPGPVQRREVRVAVRFENLDGEVLDGLLYPEVRAVRGVTRSAEPIDVDPVSSDGYVHIGLAAAHLDADLCGYSTGYVPRRIALRDLAGYPDHLQPIRFRFERGVRVEGRVVDGSGRGVHAVRVRIHSTERMAGGHVSFGPAHARVTGGIWETTVTEDDGGYAFTGVAPGVAFRMSASDKERLLATTDPLIQRAASDPCVVDLVIR